MLLSIDIKTDEPQHNSVRSHSVQVKILPKLIQSETTVDYREYFKMQDMANGDERLLKLGKNYIEFKPSNTTAFNYLDYFNSHSTEPMSLVSSPPPAKTIKLLMLSTNLIEPRLSSKFYRKGNFMMARQDKTLHALSTKTRIPTVLLSQFAQKNETGVYLKVQSIKATEKSKNYGFDENTKFEIENNLVYDSRKEFMEFATRFENKFISDFSEHLSRILTLNASGSNKGISHILVKGPAKSGKAHQISIAASLSGYYIYNIEGSVLASNSETNIKAAFQVGIDTAKRFGCIIFLRDINLLCPSDGDSSIVKKIFESIKTIQSYPRVVIIATTTDPTTISTKIMYQFDLTLTLPSLTAPTRASIIQSLLADIPNSIDYTSAGKLSSGMNLENLLHTLHTALLSPPLTTKSFSCAIDNTLKQSKISRIPNISWDDIGGLEAVKKAVMETITLPSTNPELFSSGIPKRTGILLYGPPGTGKTLVAKAIATSLKLNFKSVKGPELLDMYIGESEANVRRIFEDAKESKPCIIFFDEIDSVAPARGRNDSGVMDRIVSQLLTEIDQVGEDVYCIAATNRPDLLDPGLLRPGRFEKMLYLGVCEDHISQEKILRALTRKFKFEDGVDMAKIAELCPLTFTGADLYALCTDANLKAIERVINRVDEAVIYWNETGPHEGYPHPTSTTFYLEHVCNESDALVKVSEQDFQNAVKELSPSLSREEIEKYLKLRDTFSPKSSKIDKKGKGKAS